MSLKLKILLKKEEEQMLLYLSELLHFKTTTEKDIFGIVELNSTQNGC